MHPQFPKVPLYLVVHLCRSALWLLLHRRHLLFPMDRLFPAVPKFHSDPLPLLRHLLPDFRKHRRFLMGQQYLVVLMCRKVLLHRWLHLRRGHRWLRLFPKDRRYLEDPMCRWVR